METDKRGQEWKWWLQDEEEIEDMEEKDDDLKEQDKKME